ncbi:MAG: hypothetical protein CMA66_04475 [Euryarchaeota archaeon]|nr:hypothetical protein [Euryarchaeota archaeon]
MANDKDFKVKNSVQPTRYVEGLGTVVAGTDGPGGLFSTTLYTGTGASLAINNGLNLSGDGGLVWTKRRSSANSNWFLDSVRGGSQILRSNTTEAQFTSSGLEITSFNSNGYTLGTAGDINNSSHTDVSWAFKKTANFFDIVTFTGDGSSNQTISHNLGSVPGMIITKKTNATNNWYTYHRGNNGGTNPEQYWIELDGAGGTQGANANFWYNIAPTSNQFTVGSAFNGNFVAYLFAHNSTSINCGTYTGNGSATGPVVTTGFKPQWLLVKAASSSGDWWIVDSVRGVVDGGNDPRLLPNTSDAEATSNYVKFTSNGFQPEAGFGIVNGSGVKYIYMAIAAVTDTDTLDLSTGSVFNYTPTASKTLKLSNPAASGTNSGATLLYNSTDLAGVADKFSTTLYTGNAGTQTITNGLNLAGDGGLVWTKSRTNSAHHELTDTVRGGGSNGNALRSNGTDTEGAGDLESFTSSGFVMGYNTADGNAAQNYVSWAWKKTPNFFDIVAYTGDGNAGKTISHNLGSVPGMMIIKERNGGRNWAVYHRSLGATKYVYLNTTDAEATHTSIWNDTAPTNSVFSVGTANNTNRNGGTYIAYLFGHNTSSGPIQCGSYTGTGGSGRSVTLGWQPQWVMIKRATGGTANWHVWDSERGIVAGGNDKLLFPDSSSGENTTLNRLDVSSTGFEIPSGNNITVDGSGDTYIYMAIAAEEGASTTYDSSIKWSGGTAPTSPAIGETDVITLDTTDGGTTYRAAHAIDGAK